MKMDECSECITFELINPLFHKHSTVQPVSNMFGVDVGKFWFLLASYLHNTSNSELMQVIVTNFS